MKQIGSEERSCEEVFEEAGQQKAENLIRTSWIDKPCPEKRMLDMPVPQESSANIVECDSAYFTRAYFRPHRRANRRNFRTP